MDSDKGSNEGMIFFRVELLRLRDLVRAVGLSLLCFEGLYEKNMFLKKYFNSNGSIRFIQIHVIQIRVIETRVIKIRIIRNSCYVSTYLKILTSSLEVFVYVFVAKDWLRLILDLILVDIQFSTRGIHFFQQLEIILVNLVLDGF